MLSYQTLCQRWSREVPSQDHTSARCIDFVIRAVYAAENCEIEDSYIGPLQLAGVQTQFSPSIWAMYLERVDLEQPGAYTGREELMDAHLCPEFATNLVRTNARLVLESSKYVMFDYWPEQPSELDDFSSGPTEDLYEFVVNCRDLRLATVRTFAEFIRSGQGNMLTKNQVKTLIREGHHSRIQDLDELTSDIVADIDGFRRKLYDLPSVFRERQSVLPDPRVGGPPRVVPPRRLRQQLVLDGGEDEDFDAEAETP